jgi:hypothetical protein
MTQKIIMSTQINPEEKTIKLQQLTYMTHQ